MAVGGLAVQEVHRQAALRALVFVRAAPEVSTSIEADDTMSM